MSFLKLLRNILDTTEKTTESQHDSNLDYELSSEATGSHKYTLPKADKEFTSLKVSDGSAWYNSYKYKIENTKPFVFLMERWEDKLGKTMGKVKDGVIPIIRGMI